MARRTTSGKGALTHFPCIKIGEVKLYAYYAYQVIQYIGAQNIMDVEEETKTKSGSYCALCGLGTARTRECRVLYSCPQVVKNNGVCGGGVCNTRRYDIRVRVVTAVTRVPEEKLFLQVLLCAWGENDFVSTVMMTQVDGSSQIVGCRVVLKLPGILGVFSWV